MKQPETYVDLDGNELPLAGLAPDEARLITRLCRRVRTQPEWRQFERFANKALATFVAGRSLPLADLPETTAFKVLEDLKARLQISQGLTPDSDSGHYLLDAIADPARLAPVRELLGLPEKLFQLMLAGGKPESIDEILPWLLRHEFQRRVRRARKRRPGRGTKQRRATWDFDTYVDLDGFSLCMTNLSPDERRLVRRLCVRASLLPRWRPFARWGYVLLGKFVRAHRMPTADILNLVAFDVLEDLIARLRIRQGKTPYTSFRWLLSRVLQSPTSKVQRLCPPLTEGVVSDILAGGANTSAEDLACFLKLLETKYFNFVRFGLPPEPFTPRVLYFVECIGGPNDGFHVLSFRHWFQMKFPDQTLYRAERRDNCPVVYDVHQYVQAIHLHFAEEG